MKKSGVRISKILIKAQILSFVTSIAVSIVLTLLVLNVHGTVWATARAFQQMNNDNPAINYSPYFQRLSGTANLEDWAVLGPITFLISGIVFGWIIAQKSKISSHIKSAIGTGLVISVLYLLMCGLGEQAQAQISNLPAAPLTWQEIGEGAVQSVYWTVFMVLGSLLGRYFSVKKVGVRTPLPVPGRISIPLKK